jgi:hypothetical protein
MRLIVVSALGATATNSPPFPVSAIGRLSDAFVDREGYRTFVADKSAGFQAALERQRSAGAR